MPFDKPPAEGTTYGFERKVDFTDDAGNELAYRAAEGMCDVRCPNRTNKCGVVGLVMRAEEQYGESVELYGIVAGEKDGRKIKGEVWLERLMNPLTDDVHIDLAPPGVEPTPENIFKLLADGPEAAAAYHAAYFIYTDGCLLDAAEGSSSSPR